MFTLNDYLLYEAEGMDPAQAQQAAQAAGQDKMVTLAAEIRKIMSMMTMANQSDVAQDANLISFIDIIEALNTTEEVVRDRLSSEGAEVDVLGSDQKQQVAANGKEWQGDEEKDFQLLFNSIEMEIKETIRSVFTVTKGEHGTGSLPQFVQAYNSLIVDRLVDALRAIGPVQAKHAVGGIIESAKKAVLDVERRQGSETSATLTQLVTKYRRSRVKTIGKKHATSRNKMDRVNLNKAMAMDEVR